MKHYILERHNPQFKKPYYRALGKLSIKNAKKKENTLYGYNIVTPYDSVSEYSKELERLKSEGFNVV